MKFRLEFLKVTFLSTLFISTIPCYSDNSNYSTAVNLYHLLQSNTLENDSAIKLIGEAQTLVKNIGTDSAKLLKAQLLNEKSWLEYSASNYKQAISDGTEALKRAEEINDSVIIHIVCYRLGSYYSKIGGTHSELGTAEEKEGFMNTGLSYLNKSLAFATTMQNNKLILQSSGGLANFYLARNELDSAKYYSEIILKQSRADDHKLRAMAFNYLGIVNYQQKDFLKAKEYFENAVNESKQVTSSLTLLSAMGNLANVYMELKKYQLAKSSLFQLIELNKESNRKQNISKNYITLYKVYKLEHKYDSALIAYEQYYLYRDSILSEEHKAFIKDLEVKYETEKKEQQVELLQKQNALNTLTLSNQRRSIFYLAIGLMLIVFLALTFFYYQRKISNIQLLQVRSKLTRSQFNPHFLNNAFAKLQAAIIEKFIDEPIINQVSSIAKFSRTMLESTFNDEWTLKDELKFLNQYIELHNDKSNLSVQIVIDEALVQESEKLKIPSAITQPILENAIEHGYDNNVSESFNIYVRFLRNQNIQIEIENYIVNSNPPQSAIKRNEDQASRGIEIVRQRIALHAKIHRQEASFNTQIVQNKFIATIKLPVVI